jgi:hypothetical protein
MYAMATRRETVEHPFRTIKMRMVSAHFLTKRLKNAKIEMAWPTPPVKKLDLDQCDPPRFFRG